MEREKISIDIGFGSLVASIYDDGEHKEVSICFESEDDMQDIALVRRAADIKSTDNDKLECLVWADECSEDYTNRFIIKRYREEV